MVREEAMRALAAKDIMTREVLAVRADWSLERLAEFLVENSISGAPVASEDGKLIGVVSVTDLVLNRTAPVKVPQSHEPHAYYLQTLEHQYGRDEIASFEVGGEPVITVHDIMTPAIYKVKEDATVQEVAELMFRSRIHRVFVTSEEEVVGIIAMPDMLKVLMDM
jgi:CBS domain-containing protein